MNNDLSPERWEEIQQLHRQNRVSYQILGGVTLVIGGLILGALLFRDDGGYATNLFTEALSLVVTVLVLNLLAQQREANVLKRRLLQQLGSNFNVVALTALEELWHRGWLQDGSLVGANLSRSDLRGADLGKANLTGVQFASRRYGHAQLNANTRLPDETFWQESYDISYLERFTNPDHPEYWRGYGLREANRARHDYSGANLRGADMYACNLWGANVDRANLRNAVLQYARLRQAQLTEADLTEAELDYADLRQADLTRANLTGADLTGANLEDATLDGTRLDGARLDQVILPNGERYTPGTDLKTFGVVGWPNA